MKNIILGITGSIAAYKAADIANGLVKKGYGVDVIMTRGAQEFITPLTFQSLTKRKVSTDTFQEYVPSEIEHISLARKADLFLIAPATADIIGKLAHGIADDMLSTVALVLEDIPCIIAPAMNTRMYLNPAVQDNMAVLAGRGYIFIGPREGRLAEGTVGKGPMEEVPVIMEIVEKWLNVK